jgi:purine-binding chemotaxis protein CheW
MESGSAVAAEAGFEAAAAPQWLVVYCDGRAAALPLERVRAIVPLPPFTRLPGCGPQVCGLAGVRGRLVTAFDLGTLLGGRPARAAAHARLLLVEHRGRTLGLVVEEAWRTTPLMLRPAGSDDGDAVALVGVGSVDGAAVAALDTGSLFERLLA